MIEKFHFIIQDIFKEFEELFEKYIEKEKGRIYFGQGLGAMVYSLFFMIPTDAFLLIAVLLETCRDCMKIFRGVFSLFLLTFCEVIFIFYLVESIKTKHKLDLSDSQIYLYDAEFNDEIKNNLNMMAKRKIYACFFYISHFICDSTIYSNYYRYTFIQKEKKLY